MQFTYSSNQPNESGIVPILQKRNQDSGRLSNFPQSYILVNAYPFKADLFDCLEITNWVLSSSSLFLPSSCLFIHITPLILCTDPH